MQQKEVQQIGLVSGPSKDDLPQTEQEIAAVEDKSIDTAETLARRSSRVDLPLSDGRTIECRTARVGHMGLVLKFIKAVAAKMQLISVKEDYLKGRIKDLQDDPLALMEILETCEEFIWPVVVALTSLKNAQQAKELELDDAAKVGKVLFEMNKDFFLQKVLPLILGSLKIRESGQD